MFQNAQRLIYSPLCTINKIMDKKITLKSLEKEVSYYRTEFAWKMSDNKTSQILSVINEFNIFFKNDECDVSKKGNGKLNATKHNNSCNVKPDFDYSNNHKSPRQFSIKTVRNTDVICDLTVRLFIDESELPKPDFNRLLTNPYEGLNSEDIEILEQQKNVDFLKGYLETDESNKWNFLCCDNLDGTEKMFDTLNELYNKKVHNTIYSK